MLIKSIYMMGRNAATIDHIDEKRQQEEPE